MNNLYYGNIKQVIYVGFAGNLLGAEHDQMYKEGVFLVKVGEDIFIELDELLSSKNEKEQLKTNASEVGQLFVDQYSLVNVNAVMTEKTKQKNK